jgi:hypothetical protein
MKMIGMIKCGNYVTRGVCIIYSKEAQKRRQEHRWSWDHLSVKLVGAMF